MPGERGVGPAGASLVRSGRGDPRRRLPLAAAEPVPQGEAGAARSDRAVLPPPGANEGSLESAARRSRKAGGGGHRRPRAERGEATLRPSVRAGTA